MTDKEIIEDNDGILSYFNNKLNKTKKLKKNNVNLNYRKMEKNIKVINF